MPRRQKIPYESSNLSRYARFIIIMLYKSPRLNNLALKANTFDTQDKIDLPTIFICCLITRMQRQPIGFWHGLRTLREDIAFTARPKIHSHAQIFRYGRSIFCLPHQPNFSDIFDLCLHWVSVAVERIILT